jgi:hypothetical protein
LSSRNLRITCIWESDEFIVFDSTTKPDDNEAYLIIDEPTEKITVHIPSHFSIVKKRIIERRVQSIAKSGFSLPKTTLRIGAGFEISISKDDTIPDGLLQVGHHYQYGGSTTYIESPPSTETPSKESSEQEYTPTFLTSEIIDEKSESEVVSYLEKDIVTEPEEKVTEVIEQPDKSTEDNETVAGRFLIALSKTGDIYISRKDEVFSAEYSVGRVEFIVKNGDIEILSTKRIPENDQTLTQAIAEAKRL